ncbi:acyl-CoA dehydrogenase [Sneathiella sp. P13V-1]|uniref:FAS1-like dehydratase domain-containing protein n=1 Tax=Sneathiella sp. P13V-1 TaxID=2697366 RepID=UPI00187B7479|nr:MaoC family dehydratase N-terminal domain-containing protein [Sneathiella sp. P13V-1]MBE7636459.1 acyl-CoA dehydrogenase [Sneathiella sp. P13V-1]
MKKNLQDWVGNSETRVEIIHQQSLDGFAALMDEDVPASTFVPPGGHWMYFTPQTKQSDLAIDGHSYKGGFLPPVDLPRRMWAGGRIHFFRPLESGDKVTKTSTVRSVTEKEGRTGKLIFVTVEHGLSDPDGSYIKEETDIVYRDAPDPKAPKKAPEMAPTDTDWEEVITPDPVMLFRYSALTYNGHRIHYDRDYVTQEEGYPGLLVHGPLIGTLLMRLATEKMPGKSLKQFDFRNSNPVFDINSFTLCGRKVDENTCEVWAKGPDGELAVFATAKF